MLHWLPEKGEPATILVDGGPSSGGLKVKETLDSIGASSIDLAVLSHCDADHVDGLLAYAMRSDRVPIRRYWGPCVPAFKRHAWLFPPRVLRGLDKTEALQRALGDQCLQSWPLEGATWTSKDGDLTLRVLSPAGRLVERLLLDQNTLSLFTQQPMPLGWLLTDSHAAPGPEDPFADLRFAIQTGEITPDRIPDDLPHAWRPGASAEDIAKSLEGPDSQPEFFGNSVLNDTSIVLLVEARIGLSQRKLLLTGDLENFTYLMARWPMGLGCEIVKAPHHGSYSYVGQDKAYDAVWQWLRPRVTMVSANGRHGLPRMDFRDSALRYGATLFCTSRRTREIVSGPLNATCCHAQFSCGRASQEPVSLSITEVGITSEGIACARGNVAGVMPIIDVRQHLVEPSPILAALSENEIRKHADWAVQWLRDTKLERQRRRGNPELEAVPLDYLRKAAVAESRFAAAAEIEAILERASREGRAWLSRSDRFHHEGRKAWVMPNAAEASSIRKWIDQYSVLQFAVRDSTVGSGAQELLYSADTGWLADRMAAQLSFPRSMFSDVVWPLLVAHLLRTRSVGLRELRASTRGSHAGDDVASHGADIIVVLFRGRSIKSAATNLKRSIESVDAEEYVKSYLEAALRGLHEGWRRKPPTWPEAIEGIISPLWVGGTALPPSGLIRSRWVEVPPPAKSSISEQKRISSWIERSLLGFGEEMQSSCAATTLSTLIMSGLEIARHPPNAMTPRSVIE